MENLIVRCSELSQLMTKGRSKSEPLGETAKSYIMQKAKEAYYGIYSNFSSKYTEKGIINENKGIELLNSVYFTDYKKNTQRITNDWLTGEADIVTENEIIDIKCSWNFDTFPVFQEEADKNIKKAGYDWQMRGYMLLYSKPKAKVVYCLTDTPENLIGYEDVKQHKFDHLYPTLKVTKAEVERSIEIEAEMYEQYKIANKYYQQLINQLKNK